MNAPEALMSQISCRPQMQHAFLHQFRAKRVKVTSGDPFASVNDYNLFKIVKYVTEIQITAWHRFENWSKSEAHSRV